MAEKNRPYLPPVRLNMEGRALLAIEVTKLLHNLTALDAEEVLRLAANAVASCTRVEVNEHNLAELRGELERHTLKQAEGQTRQ